MEIKHFSHEHTLILKDTVSKADERQVLCYGCEKQISEVEPAYVCGVCSKGYFLHKVCAELPREIIHPKHDNHSLILLSRLPYYTKDFRCDECRELFRGFTYHCSLCEYDLDISCAVKDNDTLWAFKDRIIKHESHQHSLIFQPRPALFRCDACGVEDKDLFYLCPSCPFLIHKSCASLPSTANREEDDHTLSLAYGLPSDYENFEFNCDICRQRIFRQYWVYYCRLCRFFVHLKCMTTETHSDVNFEQKVQTVLLDEDPFRLPTTDVSEMIKRFLLGENSLAHIQPEIKHPSHEQHPLILIHEQPNDDDEEEVDEEVLCNCCITPLSAPYYACVECSYFLHLPCANITLKLKHPHHPHPLYLNTCEKFYHYFDCNNCNCSSNGFFFKCETCDDFFLDAKCAALPTVIVHENHNHPLFQIEASDELCNACNSKINHLAFGCETCNFSLDYDCAMLPTAIRHRWDKHPIPLRFPPYSDHPDDFICDICEEEMHPKFWLYHCSDCDNSVHPNCVPRLGRFPNVKFGGTLEVSSHPHPLEYKRKATLKSSCDSCEDNIDRGAVFECEECNFCLCIVCGDKMS